MFGSTRTRIIAAHAGTGKTTLARRYPDKFTDFVCMPYKYHLPEICGDDEGEARKANPDYELNFEYPENYFNAIKNELEQTDKTLLIPPDPRLLRLLEKENIPYLLCYPENTEEAKQAYKNRYIERGNTEDFLYIFIDGWQYFMDILENDEYGRHIIMKPNEYLTDVI